MSNECIAERDSAGGSGVRGMKGRDEVIEKEVMSLTHALPIAGIEIWVDRSSLSCRGSGYRCRLLLQRSHRRGRN